MKIFLLAFIIFTITNLSFSSEKTVNHFRFVKEFNVEGNKIYYIFICKPHSKLKYIKEIFIFENLYVSFESFFPGALSKDYKSDMEIFINFPKILTIKYFINGFLKEHTYLYCYYAEKDVYYFLDENNSSADIWYIRDKVLKDIDNNFKEIFKKIFKLNIEKNNKEIKDSEKIIAGCEALEGKFGDSCEYWKQSKYKNKIQIIEIKLMGKNCNKN